MINDLLHRPLSVTCFPTAKKNPKVLPTNCRFSCFYSIQWNVTAVVKRKWKWVVNYQWIFFSGYFLASASRVKQSKSNPSLSLGSALSSTWISSSILSRTFSSILEFSFLLDWTLAVEWTLIEARPEVFVAPELLSSSSSKIVDEQFLDAYIWFKIVD